MLANNVDPDQTPHNVASELGLHCLPTTLLWFPDKNGLKSSTHVGRVHHLGLQKLFQVREKGGNMKRTRLFYT